MSRFFSPRSNGQPIKGGSSRLINHFNFFAPARLPSSHFDLRNAAHFLYGLIFTLEQGKEIEVNRIKRLAKANSFEFKTTLVVLISAAAVLFSTAVQAIVPCFPAQYPGTVDAGNVVSGGRACFPATGTFPAGCAILNFASNTPPGAFTKQVLTTPGADFFCDGTQRQRQLFVTFTGNLGSAGYTRPKWQVLGLTYAPPGMHSTATYSTGFLNGSSESVSQSFQNTLSIKVTAEGTALNPGGVGGGGGGSNSAGWTQESDSSSSVSIQDQDSSGLIVPGPVSSAAGIDHGYDVVYVWLNPELQFVVFPASEVDFAGFAYDQRDTVTGMDVVPLTVGQLRGTQTIPSDLQDRLNRTWDTSLGALNAADFAAIVDADPFANSPAFNPNTDTSGRFELPEINGEPQNLIFNYIPAAEGEQPSTSTYTSLYNSTSTTGQGGKRSFTLGFSIDGSVTYSTAFKATLTVSDDMTWSNQWSQAITAGSMQTANFSIVGPTFTDGYTGPTAMQVWKDNIYGTFMFYPEN